MAANQNQGRAATQQNMGAPENPEHATNPKWAEQFEKAAQSLTALVTAVLPKLPVTPQQQVEDRESWTTPEQAEVYDNMVGRDFFKLDEKTKRPIVGKLYRVTHVYPEFQTANSNEFKARFNVEQFEWEKQKGAPSLRKVTANFTVYSKTFAEQYKQTAPDPEQAAEQAAAAAQ